MLFLVCLECFQNVAADIMLSKEVLTVRTDDRQMEADWKDIELVMDHYLQIAAISRTAESGQMGLAR